MAHMRHLAGTRSDLVKYSKAFLLLPVAISVLLMLALGAAGFWTIVHGLAVLFQSFAEPQYNDSTPVKPTAKALGAVLEGFEFLLLAPIPVVIVVTVTRYLSQLLELRLGDAESRHRHEEAEHGFHALKQLVLSLMISVVATDLLKRFLENHLLRPDYSLRAILFGGALFILLSVYLIVRVVWVDQRHQG